MGVFQKALETYESHYAYAAEQHNGSTMMAPVGHIVAYAAWEITLDENGCFIDAGVVDKTEPKIIIPATEKSAGRTSAPCAHPLCEQIEYLMPSNEEKYALYVEQLSEWNDSDYSHPMLKPILQYIKSGTIIADLVRCNIVNLNAQGIPETNKQIVRWRVLDFNPQECWLDNTLFEAFTSYYLSCYEGVKMLCMVSGEEIPIADQHPKGIVPICGNAKLISANDSKNFTYRGRFEQIWQAATVGYEASQKAHSALRWLIQEQSVNMGGRVFLCWNPQGRTIHQVHLPLFCSPGKPVFVPSEYQKTLYDLLNSRKAELKLTDSVVIAAFDAATTGRLSLTYYSELLGHDFLQRLHDWDISCCWPHGKYGIESPSLREIVDCAFGTPRKEKDKTVLQTDERVLRQIMQRLIACRVDKTIMGADIVKALVDRASRPQAYDNTLREKILFTACAVIRKYRTDKFKEECSMALEPEKRDRSYQFGRLLAVMEKVERDTYSEGEDREPNAIRMQSVYCQRPMYTASILEKQLERAYFPRIKMVGRRAWYKQMIGQIVEIISSYPQEEWNKPLADSYLMGYYLQRNALFTKNMKDKTEENEQ